jgi:hypothetical protein
MNNTGHAAPWCYSLRSSKCLLVRWLAISPVNYMCPHTIYVSSYCICVAVIQVFTCALTGDRACGVRLVLEWQRDSSDRACLRLVLQWWSDSSDRACVRSDRACVHLVLQPAGSIRILAYARILVYVSIQHTSAFDRACVHLVLQPPVSIRILTYARILVYVSIQHTSAFDRACVRLVLEWQRDSSDKACLRLLLCLTCCSILVYVSIQLLLQPAVSGQRSSQCLTCCSILVYVSIQHILVYVSIQLLLQPAVSGQRSSQCWRVADVLHRLTCCSQRCDDRRL